MLGGSLPNSTEQIWAEASSLSPEGPRGGQGHLDGRRSGEDVRIDHFRNWNSENFQDKRLRTRVQSRVCGMLGSFSAVQAFDKYPLRYVWIMSGLLLHFKAVNVRTVLVVF